MICHLVIGSFQGFVELEELTCGTDNEMQWKERARWIKFEEDVEQNEQWGKPHIASLSFHSLLELRRGIESGRFSFVEIWFKCQGACRKSRAVNWD